MNYLAQIILAARNRNGEDVGWMQMLVIAVLMVFYAVGSILKAKASKLKENQELEREPEEPRIPPRQRRPQPQPPRRKVMRPAPAVRKPAAKAEQLIRLPTFEPEKIPELSRLKEPEELVGKPLEGLKEEPLVSIGPEKAEKTQTKAVIEPLLDFENADQLKRLILHYEILGKPLSLRKPAEHIHGF